MSGINPRLIYWIKAVYAHPALSSAHRDILIYMAVMKLDFGTGCGYCSVQTLAEGPGWHPSTVKRALQLARTADPKLLRQTRRGHHLGDGRRIASEWALIYPAMPADDGTSTSHQDDVDLSRDLSSTAQKPDLNSSELVSQRRPGEPPSGFEGPSGCEATSGSERHRRALAQLRMIDPSVTISEAAAVLDELRSRPTVRNPVAVLGAEIASGNGWALIERARHRSRKADMAQLDNGRGSQADPEHVATMLNALRAEQNWPITNSAESRRYSEILGWLEGELLAVAVGDAAYFRELADFMEIIEGMQHIAPHSDHDVEHGDHDPAEETQ